MTQFFRCAAILSLFFVACQFPQSGESIEAETPGYIAEGNYVMTTGFYEAVPSGPDTVGTIVVYLTQYDRAGNSLINRLISENYPFSRQFDTLTMGLFCFKGLGSDGKDTANIYGRFLRVSPDTGIHGVWKLVSRYTTSNQALSAADSLESGNYNPGIGWLEIAPAKFTVYYYKDSLPGYTTSFRIKYRSALLTSDFRIDSTSKNSFNLVGLVSKDTVFVSQDTAGTVLFKISLADTLRKSLFKPNPYFYNPQNSEIAASSPTPFQEYPDWINRFLNDNKKILPEISAISGANASVLRHPGS